MVRLSHVYKTVRNTWVKSSAMVISVKSAILRGYCIVLSWRLYRKLYYLVSKMGNYCGISEVAVLELSINPDKEYICKTPEPMDQFHVPCSVLAC